MDFSELIRVRQSTRKYSGKPVEEEKIERCIEAARLAPSANNSQPWKLVVVDDPLLKEKMASSANDLGLNRFAHQAPVIVAVVLEKMNPLSNIGSAIKNKDYSLMDIGIVTSHFCLQAAELGLGTCILGWFKEREVKKILGIGKGKRVPLLITLGYPDSAVRKKIRKPREEMSSRNHY